MTQFEQLMQSNPLLEGLPLEISWTELTEQLAVNPFAGVDVTELKPVYQDYLVDRYESLYVPTATTTQIAGDIHRMLINGLIDRHPHSPTHKRYAYQVLQHASGVTAKFPESVAIPRGMLLKGVTKMGKSRLIERVLAAYPQVIDRSRDDRAGWLALKQLVYLVIPMPSDASKAGFLMNAFIELDKALGTNYAQEAKIRNATIDIQLSQLLGLLVQHRCGLLVVEEGQENHELGNVKFGRSFLTFFLRLLNTGIPTVLIGNPLAFADVESSSQLMSRLSNPGAMQLKPCSSPSDEEWKEDYVPGIWGANLLPEPDEPLPELENYLYERTGGFVHYLSMLRREATRLALVNRERSLTRAHIEQAMQSTVMQVGAQIITSYWNGLKGNDTDFTDIPGRPSAALARRGKKKGQGATA